ncbi:MAG TPA: enoyl-CoA hydratase-related protein [Chloroflexia bacterium]|nr:enoyl-CoA hydratase-related protein [Chloroflexia bacterium]
MEHNYKHLIVTTEGKVLRVALNRPEVHNAFNQELIEEITAVFTGIAKGTEPEVRAVVLSGEGKSFCAGADVNWMKASLEFSDDENKADATRLAKMLEAVESCPCPVVAAVHGSALGGGAGLIAACDIVIAAQGTRFAFSEAKLGIAPAVISPFVVRKIGVGHARALFLTAERFDSDRALQIGLVHRVVGADELDSEVQREIGEILTASPAAIPVIKSLLATLPLCSAEDARTVTVETIARLRTSPEGQEGLRAFLEKRKPGWAE